MKLARMIILLFTAWLAVGCREDVPPPAAAPQPPSIDPLYGHLTHAQPKLPTVNLRIGTNELVAEIAKMPIEIATGMMFRTNIAENEAMLFVFPNAAQRSFYMRNCYIPLSGAYISPSGEILQIIDMKPHDPTSLPSYSEDVQFVLEVRHNWFQRHSVNLGDRVKTEKGSLQETFFPRR